MKKQWLCFLALALWLSSAPSCGAREPKADPAKDTVVTVDRTPDNREEDGFARFLDAENFVSALSQGDLMEQMATYSYEGTPITDLVVGFHYDGEQGGGYGASGALFGFRNDFTVTDGMAAYSNQFYTETALEGLELLYGVEMGDTLTEVFKKIGHVKDPYRDFKADEGSDVNMTLNENGRAQLIFQNLKLTQDPVEYERPYVLGYVETYAESLSDGRDATVERTIQMVFHDRDGGENDTLARVEIRVCRSYPSP